MRGDHMLSDQENFRLAEIEHHLLTSDPRFARRMRRDTPRRGFWRWFLGRR
ncbi:MAG TPA: DUF3040 domain-containing protein [Micromonosporaceae bacterium]|jgi:hypothetical protein